MCVRKGDFGSSRRERDDNYTIPLARVLHTRAPTHTRPTMHRVIAGFYSSLMLAHMHDQLCFPDFFSSFSSRVCPAAAAAAPTEHSLSLSILFLLLLLLLYALDITNDTLNCYVRTRHSHAHMYIPGALARTTSSGRRRVCPKNTRHETAAVGSLGDLPGEERAVERRGALEHHTEAPL